MNSEQIQKTRQLTQRLDRVFGWLLQTALSPIVLFWMWLLWQKVAVLFPGHSTNVVQRVIERYLLGPMLGMAVGAFLLSGFVNVAISTILKSHAHAFDLRRADPLASGDSVGRWRARLLADGSLSILRQRVPTIVGILARIAADSCVTIPIIRAWEQFSRGARTSDVLVDLLSTLILRCLPFIWWTNWYTLPTEIRLEPLPEPTIRIRVARLGVWPTTYHVPASSVEAIQADLVSANYADVYTYYASDASRVAIRAIYRGRMRSWSLGGFGIVAVLPWNRARMAATLRAFVHHAKEVRAET